MIIEGIDRETFIHDFLSADYTIEGLRNLLRDLICIHEVHGQAWAADIPDLLKTGVHLWLEVICNLKCGKWMACGR